jgi:hypothetical protein
MARGGSTGKLQGESMETVYIVGIVAVAVVLLGVVWLLRDRITTGRFGASATEKKVEAEFKAASPRKEKQPSDPAPAPEKPPSVDISGNVMVGTNVVRIWRNSVRVARNWLLGEQDIEVGKQLSPPASEPKKRKKKQ